MFWWDSNNVEFFFKCKESVKSNWPIYFRHLICRLGPLLMAASQSVAMSFLLIYSGGGVSVLPVCLSHFVFLPMHFKDLKPSVPNENWQEV